MKKACFLLLCFLVIGGPVKAGLEATAVRLGDHGDKTRFVMELTGAPAYRLFTLPDPHRVVIDLPALEDELHAKARQNARVLAKEINYLKMHRERIRAFYLDRYPQDQSLGLDNET